MTEDIEARVIKAVAGHMSTIGGAPRTDITSATTLGDDLGADSLDKVEITMLLEEEFGELNLYITDEEIEGVDTVGDFVAIVAKRTVAP
jgi:acyl carrier protein